MWYILQRTAAAALVHAVMFPMPGPSHVNPMLHLAKILVGEGFHVTFVNTEHIQRKMFGWAEAEGKGGGMLRFVEIEDGLPEGHGRFEEDPIEMMAAVLNMEPKLVRILESIIIDDETMFGRPRPTCIIADAFCSWVQNVADRFSIPRVALWTTPIHANLAYHQRKLGEKDNTMTTVAALSRIPGMPPLSQEDDISFFLLPSHHFLNYFFRLFAMKRADEAAWNLGNNISEMETETWREFVRQVPNFLPIGPLFEWPRVDHMEGDEEYMRWLEGRGVGEVVYVSFGSFVQIREQDMEAVAKAVEESGVAFLWTGRIREGSAAEAAVERMVSKGQGFKVGWVAQMAVLAHPSVGAFLSHCGWNSILESSAMGVPLIACPIANFAEQRLNAHFVGSIWRTGFRVPCSASWPSSSSAISTFDPSHLASLLHRLIRRPNHLPPPLTCVDIEEADVRANLSTLSHLIRTSSSSSANLRIFISDMRHRAFERLSKGLEKKKTIF